ncbi:MAG: EamA family transporter [Chitinophagaceae bacterium]|nr:EamA family transporter [Chitinophagaceae bacterium]
MPEPDRIKKISLAGFVITFLGAVLFSTKAIIVKSAFAKTEVDALTLLTLRMVFSLPFYLLAAFLVSNKQGNVKLSAKQWLSIILLGLFGYYLSSLFDFVGLQYISAGLERLILFLYPTFVVFINIGLFKQRISPTQKLALLLTYAGIGLAYIGELRVDTHNPDFYWGSFLIFLCSITYAVYISGSGRIIPIVGGTKFTAYAMLASTAGIFIHFMVQGSYTELKTGAGLWGYGILLAILATVIPSFMISNGLKRIGSNNVAIISSIGPVSTIVQAHFILGEKIFITQVIGTILVIGGVLLIGWKSQTAEE